MITHSKIQCNVDLVTFNLVATCDLVNILQRLFSIYYIKSFNLVTLCDLVIVLAETKSVTKSRLHCIQIQINDFQNCTLVSKTLCKNGI